jgi:hypothetical protein
VLLLLVVVVHRAAATVLPPVRVWSQRAAVRTPTAAVRTPTARSASKLVTTIKPFTPAVKVRD